MKKKVEKQPKEAKNEKLILGRTLSCKSLSNDGDKNSVRELQLDITFSPIEKV